MKNKSHEQISSGNSIHIAKLKKICYVLTAAMKFVWSHWPGFLIRFLFVVIAQVLLSFTVILKLKYWCIRAWGLRSVELFHMKFMCFSTVYVFVLLKFYVTRPKQYGNKSLPVKLWLSLHIKARWIYLK